jgi:hypothetical protein
VVVPRIKRPTNRRRTFKVGLEKGALTDLSMISLENKNAHKLSRAYADGPDNYLPGPVEVSTVTSMYYFPSRVPTPPLEPSSSDLAVHTESEEIKNNRLNDVYFDENMLAPTPPPKSPV